MREITRDTNHNESKECNVFGSTYIARKERCNLGIKDFNTIFLKSHFSNVEYLRWLNRDLPIASYVAMHVVVHTKFIRNRYEIRKQRLLIYISQEKVKPIALGDIFDSNAWKKKHTYLRYFHSFV